MSKKDLVWVVEEQTTSSWSGEYTDDTEVISIHRTKEGAEAFAKECELDLAVDAITDGNICEHKEGPDKILGAIEDKELAEALRKEAAKPGAIFMEALFKILEENDITTTNITVGSREIRE